MKLPSFFKKKSTAIALGRSGVLGINARNLDYLFPNNPRRLYKFADDKLETKKIANEVGVSVPETYGVIRFQNEVKQLAEIVGDRRAFVLKPGGGSGGDGILVIKDLTEAGYHKASGEILSLDDIKYHLYNTLCGMFSLSGSRDVAIIEYAVEFDPVFEKVAYQGVPDIRVIVYRGVPAMAMLRLPTKVSDGKANLHRGGVGVGIDIGTGQTTVGIQHNRYIDEHPETKEALTGIAIPHWDSILEMSSALGTKTEFGYLGIDFVLDATKGPLLLEINARPGLSIQIANQEGLIPRLKVIDEVYQGFDSRGDRLEFAKRAFTSNKTNKIGEEIVL